MRCFDDVLNVARKRNLIARTTSKPNSFSKQKRTIKKFSKKMIDFLGFSQHRLILY